MLKSKLRKKILKIREKTNKKNIQIDFNQITGILKKEKITKKIMKIGLALTIQKIDKVPININDQKLDYIVTNKYIIK